MAIDGFIYGGNTGLTYEQLKRRRAVAAALAAQRRGYPKTVGEGLTYLGESIGDTLAELDGRVPAAERPLCEAFARELFAKAPAVLLAGGDPASLAAMAAGAFTFWRSPGDPAGRPSLA